MVLVAIDLAVVPALQFIFMVLLNICMIIYLIKEKPFKEPRDQNLEVFNELCFIVLTLHLFAFTEYTEDASAADGVGWSMISFTILNISVNLLVSWVLTIKTIILWCKKCRAKCARTRKQDYSECPPQ